MVCCLLITFSLIMSDLVGGSGSYCHLLGLGVLSISQSPPIPIPNFIPEWGGGKSNIKLVSWFQAACLQVASLVYSAVWLALFRLLKIRWLTRRKMWQVRAPIRRLVYWQQNVDFECLFTFKEFFKKFSFLKNLLHFPFTSTWSSWFVALILALAASFLYRYLFVKEWKQICTQLLYNKQ